MGVFTAVVVGLPIDLNAPYFTRIGPRTRLGVEAADLAVAAARTALGVLCLSLCPRCGAATMAPPVAVATAARLVHQHAQHVGIDLDEMAAALRE